MRSIQLLKESQGKHKTGRIRYRYVQCNEYVMDGDVMLSFRSVLIHATIVSRPETTVAVASGE